MGFIAALFANGKIVTGCHHGDAFCKLSKAEKAGSLLSGFLDAQTGHFVSDKSEFYVKKIILIRHAKAYNDISEFGRLQCERTANRLCTIAHSHPYVAFSCQCLRVYSTALAICGQIGLPLSVGERFCDPLENESTYEFLERLKNVIESLPEYSIIISHSDFIVNMTQLAIGEDITQCKQWKNKIPNCSITYVENNQPIWIGEDPM